MKNNWIELWQPKHYSIADGAWLVAAAEMRQNQGLVVLGNIATVELFHVQADIYDADYLEFEVKVPGAEHTTKTMNGAREYIKGFYSSFPGEPAAFNMLFIATETEDGRQGIGAVPPNKSDECERITRSEALKRFSEASLEEQEFWAWKTYFMDFGK